MVRCVCVSSIGDIFRRFATDFEMLAAGVRF